MLLASVGALRGLVNTSRDIMVRHAVPGASVGTVFAFVTTGFMFGQAVSPTIYGLLMDGASPGMVFWASAAFLADLHRHGDSSRLGQAGSRQAGLRALGLPA